MQGRSTFSRQEAAEIKQLLREKASADRSRQKSLRGKLRSKHGFYISDFSSDAAGFTALDFDHLVQAGTITIQGGSLEEDMPGIDLSILEDVPSPEHKDPELDESKRAGPAEFIAETLQGDPVSLVSARRAPSEGGLPEGPGFYAWWTKRGSIPGVPKAPHPSKRGLDLFYIGIAPVRESSSSSLRTRVIKNHMSGNTASSTFRLTLASLLLDSLNLHPLRTMKKVILSPQENTRLSRWQDEHLFLTWCVHQGPWEDEVAVVGLMAPPLNLAGNSGHPFHATLTAARRRFRTEATRQ